jgi:hypothetical protein
MSCREPFSPRPPAPGRVGVAALLAIAAGAAAAQDPTEARRLFDLGDYPAAEREILKVLDSLPAAAAAERAVRLAQLAEVRSLQGASGPALDAIASALALDSSAAVHQSAVFVCFRARRYHEALPHLDWLLARDPTNASHLFSRGIARAKEGRFADALPDLAHGLSAPESRRDARFESALALARLDRPAEALVFLREIIEDDPFDAEAVHQAARQLIALRQPDATRVAAALGRYLEALREGEGPSSKDEHLAFAGRPLDAARERAARWERLGRYDRELAEAAAMRRIDAAAADAWLRSFWERQGFQAPPAAPEVERALAAAAAAGDGARATRLARLLLALAPASVPALTRLAAAAADPTLLAPRLHYVSRLAAADPGDPRWKAELPALRRALEGAPGR